MDWVACLSGHVEVVFQKGVNAGALIGKGVFERWISLCVMLRGCVFPQTSSAWKTLHFASGFELVQYNSPPADRCCLLLGRR